MLSFYEMKTQITSAYFIFIGWKKVPTNSIFYMNLQSQILFLKNGKGNPSGHIVT